MKKQRRFIRRKGANDIMNKSLILLVLLALAIVPRIGIAEEGAAAGKPDGLPLVEIPSGPSGRDSMVVLISGDGGWSVTEKGLSGVFSENGVPVVGINSLHYFWRRRTPEGISEDLARVLSYYLEKWDKKYAVVIGYSMGADVAAFMISGLPPELYSKVSTVVLLGPGREVDLKFHLTNWVGGSQGKSALPVGPELEKLKGKDIECVYGDDDKNEICTSLPPGLAHNIERKGGHRVGFDYGKIASLVLGKIPEEEPR